MPNTTSTGEPTGMATGGVTTAKATAAAMGGSTGMGTTIWASRWFLPVTLGVAALAEFLLNRIAQPLATALRGGTPQAWPLLGAVSRYSLNLAGVLGVIVVTAMLLRATAPGGAASRPLGRFSVFSMGALLCLLSTFMLLTPDGLSRVIEMKRAQWLIELSSVCVATLVVLGVLTQPLRASNQPGRHKLGVLLLLLPPLLLLETQWGVLTNIRLLQRYGLLTLIYGPVLAVAALGAAALCLTRLPFRLTPLPMLMALLATTGMAVMLHRLPNLTTRMIYMSFDLRLPPHAESYVIYLLSLCAWVFALVALALCERRLLWVRMLGLLLVGLAGCQARALHQLLYYLVGLLCVAESLLDPAGESESRPINIQP